MSFREHTTLGRTGLEVSRLGIGSGYGVPAVAVEHAFHEFGVNYLYWSLSRRGGMTDAIHILAPSHREDIVIAMQTYDHTGLFLRSAHERGLRKLGIEYADVLILGSYVTAAATARHIQRLSPQPAVVSLVAMGAAGLEMTPDDEACADYLEHLLAGRPYDHSATLRRVVEHECTQKFLRGDQDHFPPEDPIYCL